MNALDMVNSSADMIRAIYDFYDNNDREKCWEIEGIVQNLYIDLVGKDQDMVESEKKDDNFVQHYRDWLFSNIGEDYPRVLNNEGIDIDDLFEKRKFIFLYTIVEAKLDGKCIQIEIKQQNGDDTTVKRLYLDEELLLYKVPWQNCLLGHPYIGVSSMENMTSMDDFKCAKYTDIELIITMKEVLKQWRQ